METKIELGLLIVLVAMGAVAWEAGMMLVEIAVKQRRKRWAAQRGSAARATEKTVEAKSRAAQ